jgi:hypothetical protein
MMLKSLTDSYRSATVPSSCGHRTRHAVQVPHARGWNEICVACWRRRRTGEPQPNCAVAV